MADATQMAVDTAYVIGANKDFFIILFAILAGWYTLFRDMRSIQKDFNKTVIEQNEKIAELRQDFNEKITELRQDFLLLRFEKVRDKGVYNEER